MQEDVFNVFLQQEQHRSRSGERNGTSSSVKERKFETRIVKNRNRGGGLLVFLK